MISTPDNIYIIGGGRWAKVYIDVLYELVSPAVNISIHSLHNFEQMLSWVKGRNYRQCIEVSSKLPIFNFSASNAVIVVNAARDHEKAVEFAVSQGVPTLVEKPMALTSKACKRLIHIAEQEEAPLAVSQIFLFARYLEKFSEVVSEHKSIQSIRVSWRDPKIENRYGDLKQYDSSLPIFVDILPHVLSIIDKLKPNIYRRCDNIEFLRGGAYLKLDLMLGEISCQIQLERNSDRRQRLIEVYADNVLYQLDFTEEPGTIITHSESFKGDSEWANEERPLASMLRSFLEWVAKGKIDQRIIAENALKASIIIDQVSEKYSLAQKNWLTKRLPSLFEVDEDIRYALTEVLQAEISLSPLELDQQIKRVVNKISNSDNSNLIQKLRNSEDPLVTLRSIYEGI
jgi:predicted dehydrogenase